MIEISGSEDCIDVICAVKYSQSCFANCCIFMWQLAVLLFYNTHPILLVTDFVINHKDIMLVWCLQWPFAIMRKSSLQNWGNFFATSSVFIMQ